MTRVDSSVNGTPLVGAAGTVTSTNPARLSDVVAEVSLATPEQLVEADGLVDRAAELGLVLLGLLHDLAAAHPEVTDVRGRGLMCAFSLPDVGLRNAVLTAVRDDERVLLLGCGRRSVRFRPALTVGVEDLAAGVAALDRVLTRLKGASA